MKKFFATGRSKLVCTISLGSISTLAFCVGLATLNAKANDDWTKSQTASLVDPAAPAAVAIFAKGAVWVRIEDARGNKLVARTFQEGDRYLIPERNDLVINARDGGRLVYLVDGRERGKLGNDGEILLGRPLNPDSIRAASIQP
jgi:hypothetical protein